MKVILTGCSSGIGAETAKQLKAQGATVIGLDLKEPKANVDEYIPIDLNNFSAIEKAVNQLKAKGDVLCNIAGVPPTLPPTVQITVNFLGLRHFTELMVSKLNDNAQIINLASMAGMKWMQRLDKINQLFALRNPDDAEQFLNDHQIFEADTYLFSKEAVIAWTIKVAHQWKDRGITVKSVSPGPIKTPILKDFEATIAKKQVSLPEAFKGEPRDIAAMVCFLCGEGGRWINGTNIVMDGGLMALRMGANLFKE